VSGVRAEHSLPARGDRSLAGLTNRGAVVYNTIRQQGPIV